METSYLFIQGGTVVNEDCQVKADVLIKNDVIEEISHEIAVPPNAKQISAEGLLILPGGIDMQTHLQNIVKGVSTADDYETGTKAALAGGTTMIVDVIMPKKDGSLVLSFTERKKWAEAKACCDFTFCVGLTAWDDGVKEEMQELSKKMGVNSFKCFMGSRHRDTLSDKALYHVLKTCKEIGAQARVCAANKEIEEEEAEKNMSLGITGPEGIAISHSVKLATEATQRAIAIAHQVNCPVYIDHVMSINQSDAISKSRRDDVLVFGEATAGGLGTDGTHYWHKDWSHAAGFVTSPPLTVDEDAPDQLMKHLANGNLQCTSSNHCTIKSSDREVGIKDFRKIPPGVNGIEDRLSIIWEKGVESGKIDPCRFVAITSSTAAKMLNLYPRKGRIAQGSDADLVLLDPTASRKISARENHEAADFNIFEGITCHGVVKATISRGKLVYENGKVTAGKGRFVATKPFSGYLYSRVTHLEKTRALQKVPRQLPVSSSPLPGSAGAPTEPDSPRSRSPSGSKTFNQSSFKLSGEQVGDDQPLRTNLKQRGQRETESHFSLG